MANMNAELYFDPVSEGICEVLGCSNAAKYRASWAQGVIVKLMCAGHKMEVEGRLFAELSPAMFGQTSRAVGKARKRRGPTPLLPPGPLRLWRAS